MFSLFVVFRYICQQIASVMSDTRFDGIVFADSWQELNTSLYAGRIIHILCEEGNMGFTFQETHYNISARDYVILPNATLASDFSASEDFQGILMNLSETYVTSIAIRSNYGIIGHLSLLRNPVMKLSERDFRICETTLRYLRMRMEDEKHLFRAELLRSFIELLYNGEYMRNRSLSHYASRLCVTPHYLSEICKKVSGKSATYWIDRFTMQEITRLLRQKELSLTEIAERMNFSSMSYFSRYVQKRIHLSPSEYRQDCQREKKGI